MWAEHGKTLALMMAVIVLCNIPNCTCMAEHLAVKANIITQEWRWHEFSTKTSTQSKDVSKNIPAVLATILAACGRPVARASSPNAELA